TMRRRMACTLLNERGSTVMNVQRAPTAIAATRDQHGIVRLRGRWPLLARGVWLALVIFTLAIFSAGLPVNLAQLQIVCVGADGTGCIYLQLSPEQVAVLQRLGFSQGDYVTYMVAPTLAMMVVCFVVSTLIAWRRADD